MSKHFITPAVSLLALIAYLSGYFLVTHTKFWFGGNLYISGLLWFYVAWLFGIAQMLFGLVQYAGKGVGLQAVAAGLLVLGMQASMFGFGALGWYLTA